MKYLSVPGPSSKTFARILRTYECPEVTALSRKFPVFWDRAKNCDVWDSDGNCYLDMTAAFAVANLGHGNPLLRNALARQAGRLMHGMGDVHPPSVKATFLRTLGSFVPGRLRKTILSQNGSDAVESAIKTAMMARAGRNGIASFEGSYHGLSFGALSLTSRKEFRNPFRPRIAGKSLFLPYPYCYRCPLKLKYPGCGMACLEEAQRRLTRAGGEKKFSAVAVEPIQGRGGEIVPPPGWLKGLADFCRRKNILLIADEIYTGFCRTGRRFACDHDRVVPDILCLGKGMTGGFPMSACVGPNELMNRWGISDGEAIHTSTFLGQPLGCAMGLAAIEIYKKRRIEVLAENSGEYFMRRLRKRLGHFRSVGEIRGKGLMIGVELVEHPKSKKPAANLVYRMMVEGLRRGVILLGGGIHQNVLSFSPPLTISRRQIDFCVDVLEDSLKHLEKNHVRV